MWNNFIIYIYPTKTGLSIFSPVNPSKRVTFPDVGKPAFFIFSSTSSGVAPLNTGVSYFSSKICPAQPNIVSYSCPKFILDGTPIGFKHISTGVPSSKKGIFSSGTIVATTPLLPCLPAILSPIEIFLLFAT